jgi:hypothetical protein
MRSSSLITWRYAVVQRGISPDGCSTTLQLAAMIAKVASKASRIGRIA